MCCELNHKCDCQGKQLRINWKEYEDDDGTKDNSTDSTGS